MNPLLAALRGRLVVSCQAYAGEPLRDPETMARMAQAVVAGGAAAIRAESTADIALIRGRVGVPVIGLRKVGAEGVFITPTLHDARAVRAAGADVVALDGTRRPRPDGLTLAETIAALHADEPVTVMADCGSLADALAAARDGADVVSTTLAGYTDERPAGDGPDLALVAELARALPDVPVFAEGRIATPELAGAALHAGAHAVVVGTAITHPTTLARRFDAALRAHPGGRPTPGAVTPNVIR